MGPSSWAGIWRVSLGIAAGAAVVGALWWWIATPAPIEVAPVRAPQSPAPPPSPLFNIEGSRLAGTDEAGRRLWELDATSLQISRDRDLVILAGVTARLYRDDVVQLELRAPAARYVGTTMAVELSGGVAGQMLDGRMLQASSVMWDGRSRRLAAADVTLVQAGMLIRADRLEAGVTLDEVDLVGHVVVRVAP